MKRKTLLAMAVALLCSVGSWAQASYNHTYTEGVTPAAGGDYFLYNIGKGQFLTAGLNYGTRATVDNSGRVLTLAAATNGFSIYTNYVSLNNRSDAKAGYLTTNGYVDTGKNDADWVFTPVSVDGYTNAFTINSGDGKYLFFDNDNTDPGCPVNVGPNTGNSFSYWLLIPKTARETAGDYSHYIINTQMNSAWEFKTWGGSTGWNDNAVITPGGLVSNRCAEKYHAIVDIYQEVKETLPAGRYKLYTQGFWRQDGSSAGPVLYMGDATQELAVFNAHGEGTTANMDGASTSFTAGYYVNSVEKFFNTNTINARLGINITANNQWVIFDNVVLDYLGQCVMDYAVALPDGGAMAAGTWYYFDIAAAADNYNATATTLGDIICTTDGYALTSAASGNVTLTATDNSFTAQRYYVKSSSANNLEIGVASYTYSVSAATADKAYIQPGQTVTVSYSANTNDPAASLTQDYSGVTFNGSSVACTPTASGFTFTVPDVAAATAFTLAIPASAIGYAAGSTYNEAQNITLTTPAIYDGIYFLKVAATYDGSSEGTSAAVGKYLARGMNYGTHATLDKYGLPLQISTDENNATSIQAFDNKRYFFHGNSWDCWADQASLAESGKFTVTLNNGKYMLHNNTMAAGTYLKYNSSAVGDANIAVFDDGTGKNSGPIIMWTTESAAEHATVMQTLKDTQAAAAAAAAYASGNYASLNGISTVADLEAELTANYIEGVFVAPSAIESISEKYQGGKPAAGNVTETVYSNTINITQPGFYKFSMQAFYRAGSNEVTQEMHTAGIDFPPVVLFFGNSETQIKSIYDEGGLDQGIADGYFETETVGGAPVQYNDKWYTNGQHNSVIIFQKDYYHNDVWFYASEPGEYSYGVKYMGFADANMQWFIYSPESVTITSYAAAADDADYTALTNAINAYDAATWGFKSGEYAPYNHVAAFENITAARAIDSEAQNSKLLVNSLTYALALSANAEEVNAVYNGDFALSENDGAMAGWVTDNAAGLGGAMHARAFVLTSGGNYDYLAAFGQGDGTRSCAYFRFDGTNSTQATKYTYGSTAGYTMPLVTGTIYKLTAQAGGWGQTAKALKMDVVNSSDESLVAQTLTTPATGVHEGGPVIDYEMYFMVPANGNYKLVLSNTSGADNAVVVSNIELFSADALTLSGNAVYAAGTYPTVTLDRTFSADNWNTLCVPFAFDKSDFAEVKELSAITVNGENVSMTLADASTIEAGKPYLVKAISNGDVLSATNVTLPGAGVQASSATADGYTVNYVGTYTGTPVNAETAGGNAFVVKNNGIYHVNSAVSVGAYRAYFTVEAGTPVKALIFDFNELPTAINAVEAAQNEKAEIYNLAGQRLNKAQKGVNIINGKKVLVK